MRALADNATKSSMTGHHRQQARCRRHAAGCLGSTASTPADGYAGADSAGVHACLTPQDQLGRSRTSICTERHGYAAPASSLTDSPFRPGADFVAYAERNGKLSYGSTGT
jgi:hypothetical protein